MATKIPITLADGIKAPRIQYTVPRPACAVSPAFTAVEALSVALAEACAAEELRESPAAWDLALFDLDVAAEDAVNCARDAARLAGDAPVVLATDRRLVFAARFIHCTLGVENAPDRDNLLYFIGMNRGLWGGDSGGLTARRAEALMDLTVGRLLRLIELMDNGASRKTLISH